MIERFQGDGGKRRLVDALLNQQLVQGTPELAVALADVMTLEEVKPGVDIIKEGAADNDLLIIVTGEVLVCVRGRQVACRRTNQHVGEMAVIDPRARRSATVVTSEECVIGRIPEPTFTAVAEKHPVLWRRVALELGDRLRERNSFVVPRRTRPHLFIGSSVEGLGIAQEVQAGLRHDHVTTQVWTDNVFVASRYPLEDLERALAESDFALLVISPDDQVTSRKEVHSAPRDNIVFELGLFIAAVGRRRTFMLKPWREDIKLPTDLLGLNPMEYSNDSSVPLDQRIGPVCRDLRKLIAELKGR